MRQDVTGFFTMLQGPRARGGVGIRARRGVGFGPRGAGFGGDSGPGREVWIRAPGAGWAGIRAPGAGWGFGPGRGVGAFWG